MNTQLENGLKQIQLKHKTYFESDSYQTLFRLNEGRDISLILQLNESKMNVNKVEKINYFPNPKLPTHIQEDINILLKAYSKPVN